MRDFFITSFERLIGVILVIVIIGVVVAAIGAAAEGGVLAFIGVLIIGALYVIMTGGFLYLALGIYHNTRRTAEAIEKLNANARIEG